MIVKQMIEAIDFNEVIEHERELPLYHEVTRDILQYLESNHTVTFNEIIMNVGGSDRRTLRLLDQLVQSKVLRFEGGSFSIADQPICPIKSQDVVCPYCDGKIVTIDRNLQHISEKMQTIYAEKPKPTFVFDQRPVNWETTVRRVSYLIWRRDIQNKTIAILGDDDLTSIAVALTGLAKRTVVFDIDERLISFIKKKSRQLHLNLEIFSQDFTKPMPKEFLHCFDVFMTDPTPTEVPFTVFTNVGIRLLKKGESSVGYLSIYPSCMRRNLKIQKTINAMGLMITDLIPFFTQYDFVGETYSERDLRLLDKYSDGISKMSFYEYLLRVQTTYESKEAKIKYKLSELLGGATKRVLSDPRMDPALTSANDGEKSYISDAAGNIVKSQDREMIG
ncbi:MAG: hypothetical protein DRP09_16820 [Candidatus Thorarchaeota archaeon]|nr:MAG: hypothetical protein DRP09_16820 [Candidatus Thorarchaeota archaeon]